MTTQTLKSSAAKPYGHREYFAALDGFRGLLALFVAIYHTIWLSRINQWEFLNNGAVIIDLFFALSGFLMFRLYEGKLKDGPSAREFMKRRFARIYPLHLFMLAIFVIFAVVRILAHKVGIAAHEAGEILPFSAGAQDSWGSLLANLTLTHAMGVTDSLTFNPPAWTISAEFFTYLLFVAVMLWVPPKKTFDFAVMALLIAGIYGWLSRHKPDMNITYDLAFARCVAGFFTGVLAAKVYSLLQVKGEAIKSKQGTVLFSALEAFVLIGSICFVIFCGGALQFFVAPVLFGFMLIFAFDGGLISKFMSAKPFRYLAKISYSVYMSHVIISIFFAIVAERIIAGNIPNWNPTGMGGDILIAVYLVVVICFSHLTYHFVEVPGGKWIRKFRVSKRDKKTTELA